MPQPLLLRDAMAVYLRTLSAEPGLSREPESFAEFVEDKRWLRTAIREGVSFAMFDALLAYAPFSEQEWADFLDVSTKTLYRYRTSGEGRMKPIHSEKVLEIAEVLQKGEDVFGTMDALNLWLRTPNHALGGDLPATLLKDSYGKAWVMDELVRIEHGILS